MIWSACSGLSMVLFGILVIALFPSLIRSIIVSEIPLVPGSKVTNSWIAPPVKPLLKIYYFNVTNPAAFLEGEVPEVEEVGPYVYEER